MAWTLTNLTTAVNLTAECDASSVAIAQRAYAETSRLSCRINDEAGAITLATEHEIVLMDGAAKAFQGYVRVRERGDTGVASQRIYTIECQDYTTALGDDLADGAAAVRPVESDKARIAALGAAFGSRGIVYSGATIVQLRAAMPEQDYTGLSLHECLTEICRITGGSFYVDFDKILHYFASEALSAPFGLSDTPNGSTTFGYDDFSLREDSTAFVNAVFVKGTGISGWRPSAAAVATLRANGTLRATHVDDPEVTTQADLDAVGDAVLAQYGSIRQPSSLVTYRPGLRAGMNVQITHSGLGLSAVTYRIASIEARPVDSERIAYTVFFGSNPISLGGLMQQTQQSVAEARLIATQASAKATAVLDLSVGGGNLVPNSSFEAGTIWTVGGSWVIGFAASDAFHGSKEARYTPSGSSAPLASPFITVDRSDTYWASAWIWCRAFTSGRLRMLVEEYSAGDTLLATTVVGEVAAAGTKWARVSRKFAPAAGVGVTGWHVSTAKIKIVFSPNGVNATGTWSVDGVQLERGGLLSAYSPAASELVEGAITTTMIADDAITTPKIAALQITAGKIAVGAIGAGQIAANAITADKIAAGAITTEKLAAGAITLYDEFMVTALGPGGFSGAWSDFIHSGFYNATFAAGTVGALPDGRTAALPYWTLTKGAGHAVSWESPGQVRFATTQGSSSTLKSDDVAVRAGGQYQVSISTTQAGGSAGFFLRVDIVQRDRTGAAIGGVISLMARQINDQVKTRHFSGIYTAHNDAVTAEVIVTIQTVASVFPNLVVYDVLLYPVDDLSTPYIAAQLTDVTLGTGTTALTDTQIFPLPSGPLNPDRNYLVIATFDFVMSVAGVGECIGELLVNGAAFGQQARWQAPTATARSGPLTVATHVPSASLGSGFAIGVRKTIAAGTAVVKATQTRVTAIPVR